MIGKNSMMRTIIILIGLFLGTFLNASPVNEKVDESSSETFFYNKGYRNGYADGEKKGYAAAFRETNKALGKYKKKIKALEAGKYLSKRHKITPPRLYQRKNNDGTVSVVVKGCSIEKQLSPKEILMLPTTNSMGGGSYANNSSYAKRETPSDNVYLPGIDPSASITPSLGGEDIHVVYKFFPDTEFYRKLFRASARPFSIVGGDRIKVIFPSQKEADGFCARHNLIPGRDVF